MSSSRETHDRSARFSDLQLFWLVIWNSNKSVCHNKMVAFLIIFRDLLLEPVGLVRAEYAVAAACGGGVKGDALIPTKKTLQ